MTYEYVFCEKTRVYHHHDHHYQNNNNNIHLEPTSVDVCRAWRWLKDIYNGMTSVLDMTLVQSVSENGKVYSMRMKCYERSWNEMDYRRMSCVSSPEMNVVVNVDDMETFRHIVLFRAMQ